MGINVWTSVDEALPEPDTDVLVALRYPEGAVITSRHAAFYDQAGDWLIWRDNKSQSFEGEVTHWMPLPDPPENT